jgi:hypothetical protein
MATEVMLKYLNDLDGIYGMYLDACGGFRLVATSIKEATRRGPLKDPRVFMGTFDDPNHPDATYKHSAKVSEIVSRNDAAGRNEILLSRSCLIFVYSMWDTSVRSEYAKSLGLPIAEIRSNILGDLRYYRNDIAHNNAVLQKTTTELKFFNVGETINLVQTQMDEIFVRLLDSLTALNREMTGLDLNKQFERPLNRSEKQ